jgi:hypothetical protein
MQNILIELVEILIEAVEMQRILHLRLTHPKSFRSCARCVCWLLCLCAGSNPKIPDRLTTSPENPLKTGTH